MNLIESLRIHFRGKIKGKAYTHRDLSRLFKKTMKENQHTYLDISKKYNIDIEEVKAICSGRYYFNYKWYSILEDYTGISIKELTRIENN